MLRGSDFPNSKLTTIVPTRLISRHDGRGSEAPSAPDRPRVNRAPRQGISLESRRERGGRSRRQRRALEAGRNGEKGRVGARVYFAAAPAEGYINYTTAQKCRIIVYKLAIDSFYKLEF